MRIILNLKDKNSILLAGRAGLYLLERPEQLDSLLSYGNENNIRFYARRNKKSISVWEQ